MASTESAAAARAWVAARQPDVPPTLARRLQSALEEVGDASATISAVLAEAALRLLDGVTSAAGAASDSRGGRRNEGEGGAGALRATALELLTADALLTWACEAAAEEGPEALAGLVAEYGPDRLAALSQTGGSAP